MAQHWQQLPAADRPRAGKKDRRQLQVELEVLLESVVVIASGPEPQGDMY